MDPCGERLTCLATFVFNDFIMKFVLGLVRAHNWGLCKGYPTLPDTFINMTSLSPPPPSLTPTHQCALNESSFHYNKPIKKKGHKRHHSLKACLEPRTKQ